MPRVRKPQYDVITDLRELSCQADSIIEESAQSMSSHDSGLSAWFQAVKDHITLIKYCNSIDEITDGPVLSSFLGETSKTKKIDTVVSEIKIDHVHSFTLSDNINEPQEHQESIPSASIISEKNLNCDAAASEVIVETPVSPALKTDSLVSQNQMKTPMISNANSSVLEKSSCKTLTLMETPVLNRTFSKVFNKTLILDSGPLANSVKKNKIINSATNGSIVQAEPGPSNIEEGKIVYSSMITRSASKRKSTDSENKTYKKCKTEASTSHKKAPANKTTRPKFLVANKNSRTVTTAVIVPSQQHKRTVIPKEQQILEELKKKEEKTKEKMKKIMTERQMKAEQIKKTREEKQTKTLQKRLQIEKEKEERLEKREIEVKTAPVKSAKESAVKQIVAKSRTQELIDEHVVASKSAVSASKHNGANADSVVKTPVSKKSSDDENYELTPLPNSSTYNFSDDDDEVEKPQGKRIPLWAQGVHLKSALMEQFYHPIDTDELFGTEIDPPDLIEIFGVKKKHYTKRTSSAVWNSPLDCC